MLCSIFLNLTYCIVCCIYDICTYIIHVPRQAHGLKTKAGRKMSATRRNYQGKQCLDIHLLKPARVWADIATAEAPGNQQVVGANSPAQVPRGEWVNYAYRTAHPILRWLPSKMAEWIGYIYGLATDTRSDASNSSRLYILNLGICRYGRGQSPQGLSTAGHGGAGEAPSLDAGEGR